MDPLPNASTTTTATTTTVPPRHSPLPSIRLPIPGSPSSTLQLYKSRLGAAFSGANPRVCTAFWLFGLINNVLYVIILSSALDLVGPTLPKSIVLLADVVPSFVTKLTSPYFVHHVPYRVRIPLLAVTSFVGMQLVAWAGALPTRLAGVVLASASSGLGEFSFLAMTHFYGRFAVPFWSSGTGGAGLVGAGLYVFATSWVGWSVRGSLMAFGFLPVVMVWAFFGVLPLAPLRGGAVAYEVVRTDERDRGQEEVEEVEGEEEVGLLARRSSVNVSFANGEKSFSGKVAAAWSGVRINLYRTRRLFFPYMLPLLIVYISEYTINLGVTPTLLFPLSSMPFAHYRDAYPTYNTLYQLGVFFARSSTPFIRVHALYPPSLLQVANLTFLTLHAMYDFLPSIYIIFAVVLWEGVLGGIVYVNTFAELTDRVPAPEREFSLGAVTVADSAGICVAGVLSLGLEMWLCKWQVDRGRDYCRRV